MYVEVITDDIEEEIVTEATVEVEEITEVVSNLEEAIKQVEETTIAVVEELSTTMPTTEVCIIVLYKDKFNLKSLFPGLPPQLL